MKNKSILKQVTAFVLSCALVMSSFSEITVVNAKSWKKLYYDFIKKNEWCEFEDANLIYIDNNNVPEIYLCGINGSGQDLLLTIYKGKVIEILMDGHGDLKYVKKKGHVYMSGGHMDEYTDQIGKLKNGKIKVTQSGEYGAENNADVKYDSKGNPIYQYFWNGKKVSKSVYNKNLKAAKGKYKYISAYKYGKMLSKEQLLKKLR